MSFDNNFSRADVYQQIVAMRLKNIPNGWFELMKSTETPHQETSESLKQTSESLGKAISSLDNLIGKPEQETPIEEATTKHQPLDITEASRRLMFMDPRFVKDFAKATFDNEVSYKAERLQEKLKDQEEITQLKLTRLEDERTSIAKRMLCSKESLQSTIDMLSKRFNVPVDNFNVDYLTDKKTPVAERQTALMIEFDNFETAARQRIQANHEAVIKKINETKDYSESEGFFQDRRKLNQRDFVRCPIGIEDLKFLAGFYIHRDIDFDIFTETLEIKEPYENEPDFESFTEQIHYIIAGPIPNKTNPTFYVAVTINNERYCPDEQYLYEFWEFELDPETKEFTSFATNDSGIRFHPDELKDRSYVWMMS